MLDIKPTEVLEDSKGSKYFFYYKDSSIFYREVGLNGEIKDTILVSQVNSDFAAAIDTDDTLYIACNSRYKGIMLFSYNSFGWKFEYVINMYNSTGIHILDMLVAGGSIHIFFSKKLPLPNMYNIYHISRNIHIQSPYIEYPWQKNNLTEIYSHNLENSYSIISGKDGLIHFAGIWHDDTNYIINYYCYDDSTKSWLHKSLSISYRSSASIRLLYCNEKVNLLCFSTDSTGNNLHHYISKLPRDMEFMHKYSTKISSMVLSPCCFVYDNTIGMEWIKDRVYHQYLYDESSSKWKKSIELPQKADSSLLLIKYSKHTGGTVQVNNSFFLLDSSYVLSKPAEYVGKNSSPDVEQDRTDNEICCDTEGYLKQILAEIKSLSENIKYLSNRIDNIEKRASGNRTNQEETTQRTAAESLSSGTAPLKKSGFKEKFMNSPPPSEYKKLLSSNDGLSVFRSTPISQPKRNENRAFALPPAGNEREQKKGARSNIPDSNNSSFFKKLAELFKQDLK